SVRSASLTCRTRWRPGGDADSRGQPRCAIGAFAQAGARDRCASSSARAGSLPRQKSPGGHTLGRGERSMQDPGPAPSAPLRYAQPPDLGPECRSLPPVDVLNLRDERVGQFDGLLLSAASDEPRYLVLRRDDGPNERRLIPIGSAWFDQTTEAVRVDEADVRAAERFDLGEFERMKPAEVMAFERRVLASCCPEVLRDAGPPAYDSADRFRCPD